MKEKLTSKISFVKEFTPYYFSAQVWRESWNPNPWQDDILPSGFNQRYRVLDNTAYQDVWRINDHTIDGAYFSIN